MESESDMEVEEYQAYTMLGSNLLNYLNNSGSGTDTFKIKNTAYDKKYELTPKCDVKEVKYYSNHVNRKHLFSHIKLKLDPEVISILEEREKIKTMKDDKDKAGNVNGQGEEKKSDVSSVSDMFSDIEDDNLDELKAKYKEKHDNIAEIDDQILDKTKTISDLIGAIETKREQEKEEKKKRDIKPAMMSDYFTGFTSTVTKKIQDPKKIRSVLEENIDKLDDIQQLKQDRLEIQNRVGGGDDYVECFPGMQDTIKGFDERNFAEKVKEKYYDEEVIQKDEEWMNSKRTKFTLGDKMDAEKLKKRDAKLKNKVNKETVKMNEYMAKKET